MSRQRNIYTRYADTESTGDKRVIACNFREATSKNTAGSLAYLCGIPGSIDRVRILTRTRSGRWVECWEPVKRLDNFRWKTIPPEHPLYRHMALSDYWATLEGTERDPVKWIGT